MKKTCFNVYIFAFLKLTHSFLFTQTVNVNVKNNKNYEMNIYSKKNKIGGYDERYSQFQNDSSIVNFKKTIQFFTLLKALRDPSITNESKLIFIQENECVNHLYPTNNVNCANSYNIYSGGLLDDWNFE